MRHATCDMRHATCDMRHATCDMRHATCDMRHATCDMRHATCDMRHATCDMRHATCDSDMRHATCDSRLATRDSRLATRHMRLAPCDLRLDTCDLRLATLVCHLCSLRMCCIICFDKTKILTQVNANVLPFGYGTQVALTVVYLLVRLVTQRGFIHIFGMLKIGFTCVSVFSEPRATSLLGARTERSINTTTTTT